MDIEQLRDIVKRKDGEGFCQFFLQLKLRDFLFLSNVDYLEIMRLAKHIGREGIIRETSFFTSLYNKARKYQTKKLSTRDLMPRDYLSLFYYDLFLQLYPDHNKKFTSALMAKGDIILDYAEQGEITIESLEESINCYDEAALIFERERAELDYAEAMMKKGYSLITLVDHGAYTYTIDKIEKSIKYYDEAASIFKREKAELDYARALMHKGISLNRLAEQGIDTIENLNESLKCYYKAGNIFKKEKAEVDYAGTLMNEGVSLRKLAEQGVDVERNFALAMKLYKEAEGIFREKKSLLELAMITDNQIRGLWWRFQKTKEEKYLIQASNLCDNSIGSDWFIDHFRHPAVKSIIKMNDKINDMLDNYLVLDKNKYDEIIKRIDEIKRDSEQTSRLREETRSILKTLTPREEKVLMLRFGMSNGTEPTLEEVGQCFQVTRERIRQIEAKALRKLRPLSKRKNISIILNKIEKSTQQIIETIKRSGEEVSEEVAKGFISLADDLRVLNEEQQRTLLKELCRLLTDTTFQNKFLSESSTENSSLIRGIFQRIGKIENEIAGHMPATLFTRELLNYFARLWNEVLQLSEINSAIVLGMVLSPFISLKNRLSKS